MLMSCGGDDPRFTKVPQINPPPNQEKSPSTTHSTTKISVFAVGFVVIGVEKFQSASSVVVRTIITIAGPMYPFAIQVCASLWHAPRNMRSIAVYALRCSCFGKCGCGCHAGSFSVIRIYHSSDDPIRCELYQTTSRMMEH